MANPLLSFASWVSSWMPAPLSRRFYRFTPLASLIRQVLNRAAPAGVVPVTVGGGGLAGVRLVLDLQKEKDYWLGTYEPELQQAVRDWVEPGNVVYDVGANIGYISLLMSRTVGIAGRVFTFEALPENLRRLELNLETSGLGSNVEIIPAAVVEAARPVSFMTGPSTGMGKAEGSAGREDIPYTHAITVEGISLDLFVFEQDNPPPDVVKIDIEGGEVLALPGMRGVLRERRPVIFLELHGHESARVAWKELFEAGYRLSWMKSGYPQINSPADLDWKAYIVAHPNPDLLRK